MAGSEAMNFMIATNYSAAKVKLEQFKQQVVPNRQGPSLSKDGVPHQHSQIPS